MVATEILDHETPIKMALSIAKEASPDSTGKELLQRYRAMVAQKSAERIKKQSLSLDIIDDDEDDDQSSLQSSGASSLASLGSSNSIDAEDDDDDNEQEVMRNNNASLNRDCKDTFADAMVQEAAMINQLVKEKILQNQMKQKSNQMTSSTTPAKKNAPKTPSKFTVFQDEKENSMACDDKNAGTPVTVKKKRLALQPKSTNANNIRPTTTEKKKNSGNATTLAKVQDTSVRKLLSSPATQSALEKKKEHLFNKSNKVSKSDPAKMESNVKEDDNNNGFAFVDEPKEKLSCTITTESTTKNLTKINHDTVVEDAGELLSFCSTVSPSVRTVEETIPRTAIQDGLSEECQSRTNQDETAKSQTQEEHEDQSCSIKSISFCQTSGASVQTFSIGGRSYSIDVSSNVIKNIFSPIERHSSTQQNVNNSDDSETLSCDTIYHDASMSPRIYLNDSVSPVSRALATGVNDSMTALHGGISKASAASLIERNKTLFKEVRFADQTCVELSERNAGMQRDVMRLESQVNEMKGSNDALQEALLKSKQCTARVEANNETLSRRIQEQKTEYEFKISELEKALMLANNRQSSTEKDLIAVQTKYESLQESHRDEKGKVAGLMERLAASQSAAEMSANSAAESYRSFCHETQTKIEKLEKLAEDRFEMFNNERNQRVEAETKIRELMKKCNDVDHVHHTPNKYQVQAQSKTPTSTVLARALESELQHKYDATERILEAEMIISVTQAELKETSRQLEQARTEIARLNDHIEKKSSEKNFSNKNKAQELTFDSVVFDCASLDVSSFDSCSTEELVGQALSQRLTYAKSECEAYQRDLESLLKDIKKQLGESFHSGNGSQLGSNDQRVQGLLLAVRELSIISSLQVNEINEFKIRERKNKEHIDILKASVNEKEKLVSELNHQVEMLKEEVNKLSLRCTDQFDEISRTMSQVHSLSEQNRLKTLQIAEKEGQCEDLVSEIRKLSQLCNRQEKEMLLMRSEIEETNLELKKKKTQLIAQNDCTVRLMNGYDDIARLVAKIKNEE